MHRTENETSLAFTDRSDIHHKWYLQPQSFKDDELDRAVRHSHCTRWMHKLGGIALSSNLESQFFPCFPIASRMQSFTASIGVQ